MSRLPPFLPPDFSTAPCPLLGFFLTRARPRHHDIDLAAVTLASARPRPGSVERLAHIPIPYFLACLIRLIISRLA